jgi:CHAD domain-containing protein
VTLQHWVLEKVPDPTAGRAFKKWKKEAKKLRRALQPVRDTDVYLAKLDGLRAFPNGATDGKPQLSSRCLRGIDKLESRLLRKRQSGADELMGVIEVRGKRLNRLSREMEAAIAPGMPRKTVSTAPAAVEIFAGLASELPHLDSTNLHAYRKRFKEALYLAEMSAAADPQAGRLAVAFRKIHNAAGEWHDWHALALEADRVLPGQGKPDGLVPVLENLAEVALRRTLGLSRHSAARFLKNPSKKQPFRPRKPVVADRGSLPREEYSAIAS